MCPKSQFTMPYPTHTWQTRSRRKDSLDALRNKIGSQSGSTCIYVPSRDVLRMSEVVGNSLSSFTCLDCHILQLGTRKPSRHYIWNIFSERLCNLLVSSLPSLGGGSGAVTSTWEVLDMVDRAGIDATRTARTGRTGSPALHKAGGGRCWQRPWGCFLLFQWFPQAASAGD